ncbi:flagellar biosynthetic protein FliR [Gemmobacter lanyuensis]
MTAALARLTEVSGWGQPVILGWFLVFIRVGGLMAVLPAFGDQIIPARVRLVVTLAFATILAPMVMVPQSDLSFGPILAEAGVGLLFGLSVRFLIFALQTAGMMIAQAISLAQLSGLWVNPNPFWAVCSRWVHWRSQWRPACICVSLSFWCCPMICFPRCTAPSGDVAQWGTGRAAHCLALAVSLAAPFLAASLLYNIALGIINRAMPQLMVSFIGAPAMTLGGLALFAVAAPLLLNLWQTALAEALSNPLAVPP